MFTPRPVEYNVRVPTRTPPLQGNMLCSAISARQHIPSNEGGLTQNECAIGHLMGQQPDLRRCRVIVVVVGPWSVASTSEFQVPPLYIPCREHLPSTVQQVSPPSLFTSVHVQLAQHLDGLMSDHNLFQL